MEMPHSAPDWRVVACRSVPAACPAAAPPPMMMMMISFFGKRFSSSFQVSRDIIIIWTDIVVCVCHTRIYNSRLNIIISKNFSFRHFLAGIFEFYLLNFYFSLNFYFCLGKLNGPIILVCCVWRLVNKWVKFDCNCRLHTAIIGSADNKRAVVCFFVHSLSLAILTQSKLPPFHS